MRCTALCAHFRVNIRRCIVLGCGCSGQRTGRPPPSHAIVCMFSLFSIPEVCNTARLAARQCSDISFPAATDQLNKSPISGATYVIYKNPPTNYHGCAGAACGIRVTQLSLNAASTLSMDAGEYLVVANAIGYYDSYTTFTVSSSSTAPAIGMVKEMQKNQDRIVLSWTSAGDRDLWLYDSSNSKCGHSNCKNQEQQIAGGTAKLDLDYTSGPGTETSQLRNMTSGTVEVWVHNYEGKDMNVDLHACERKYFREQSSRH